MRLQTRSGNDRHMRPDGGPSQIPFRRRGAIEPNARRAHGGCGVQRPSARGDHHRRTRLQSQQIFEIKLAEQRHNPMVLRHRICKCPALSFGSRKPDHLAALGQQERQFGKALLRPVSGTAV